MPGSGTKYPGLPDGAEAIGWMKLRTVLESDPTLLSVNTRIAPLQSGYVSSKLVMPNPDIAQMPFIRPTISDSWQVHEDLKHYHVTTQYRLFMWVAGNDEVDALNFFSAVRAAVMPLDVDRYLAVRAILASPFLLMPDWKKSASNLELVHQQQDCIKMDATLNLLVRAPINIPSL